MTKRSCRTTVRSSRYFDASEHLLNLVDPLEVTPMPGHLCLLPAAPDYALLEPTGPIVQLHTRTAS